eukprot:353594-Chlamydomonas_euryale.AAC.1
MNDSNCLKGMHDFCVSAGSAGMGRLLRLGSCASASWTAASSPARRHVHVYDLHALNRFSLMWHATVEALAGFADAYPIRSCAWLRKPRPCSSHSPSAWVLKTSRPWPDQLPARLAIHADPPPPPCVWVTTTPARIPGSTVARSRLQLRHPLGRP